MHKVEPKVFLVGETKIVKEGLNGFLKHVGVPKWKSDASTDLEKIIEVMGRLCYRSFEPGLNKNVKKVREHNKDPRPFIWTASASAILRKIKRCKEALETGH